MGQVAAPLAPSGRCRAEKPNAGRRPACSEPFTGSNSTHAMSPTSGSIFLPTGAVGRDLAARVSIVDDFRTDVRPPVDELRLILGSHALHCGSAICETLVCDEERLSDPQAAC